MNTEVFQDINWIAVIVAALAYFMIGALWYSPVLFAKKWIRYTNVDATNPEMKKGAGMIMLGSVVMMFICAAGLAILMNRLEVTGGWMSGVKLGLLTGICFAATAVHISFMYEKRPIGLHAIDAGYNLVGHVVAAVIIAVWQ